uniref:PDZ domain-containing protein n=1 Tax=Macrostomum lignano TaxID=282301 RepID=A0A1I8FBL3_9PLAT
LVCGYARRGGVVTSLPSCRRRPRAEQQCAASDAAREELERRSATILAPRFWQMQQQQQRAAKDCARLNRQATVTSASSGSKTAPRWLAPLECGFELEKAAPCCTSVTGSKARRTPASYWAVVSNARRRSRESNRVGLVCGREEEGSSLGRSLPAPDEFRFRRIEVASIGAIFRHSNPSRALLGEGDPVKVLVKLSGNPR